MNVIVPGPYTFTTGAVNGVTFSASGTFTNPGLQNVTLNGTGIPVDYTIGNGTFTYTVTNTNGTNAGSCNFTRKVYVPDQNYTGTIRNDGLHRFLYKVILGPGGNDWLQTNLGSHYNNVDHPSFNPEAFATGVDDYRAFGSLFQLGRNSDGHELVNWTSATTAVTTDLSNTASPAPTPTTTPVNTGLFYTSTDANYTPGITFGNWYGLAALDVTAGRRIVGPGKPCPTGFMIALNVTNTLTPATAPNYYGVDSNAGSAYWIGNTLKLVAPKVYRNGGTGNLTAYNRRLMRQNEETSIPVDNPVISPEYVIEGGIMTIPSGDPSYHRDRRISETWNTATENFDPRGSLDGYPVRCVKR
ncbi:hypothetical protein ACFOEQ_24575 [Chryseobacterium arachidis]|uniref:hypothetical protein n=1 Tax=Chryseobacterium arachidis TaxID=1416778 RepID=UPI00360E84DC